MEELDASRDPKNRRRCSSICFHYYAQMHVHDFLCYPHRHSYAMEKRKKKTKDVRRKIEVTSKMNVFEIHVRTRKFELYITFDKLTKRY